MFAILSILLLIVACWVPRDPSKTMFLGALIGAGAALIGGSKNRKAQKEANEANLPVNQVAQWEAAGINPTFGISKGQWIPQQAASMGDSFATAGSFLAEALDRDHAEKLEATKLKDEKKGLEKQLKKALSPTIPSNMDKEGVDVPSSPSSLVGNNLSNEQYIHPRFGPFNGRPQSRPTAEDEPKTRVFLPDGGARFIPSGMMGRADIRPNTTISMGEYEDVVGDFRSSTEGVIFVDSIGDNLGVPVSDTDDDPFDNNVVMPHKIKPTRGRGDNRRLN